MNIIDVYEELKTLKDDPKAFAKRQKEIIDEAISEYPEEYQKRLRQNNWCLEQELKKYKDPVARMNKMIEIFWQGVYKFEDALNGLLNNEKHSDAKVIPFKKE